MGPKIDLLEEETPPYLDYFVKFLQASSMSGCPCTLPAMHTPFQTAQTLQVQPHLGGTGAEVGRCPPFLHPVLFQKSWDALRLLGCQALHPDVPSW